MKLVFMIVILVCGNGKEVLAQSTAMSDSAYRIAKKIKDTLSLTENQLNQVYNINMQLQLKKLSDRQQGGMGQQVIENTRDSLYRKILPDSLFILYKQKKQRLLIIN